MAAARKSSSLQPLPMTPEEVAARGWDAVDVVFVTGDAYVDHPSFAMALLGRALEAEGYRVAILSQPDWHSAAAWQTFGRPRLCFAVSAGNMDSMLNHYTANRKPRSDDAYSPGGQMGRRPDRATLAYCQRAREAHRGVPIIAGGVEASLRRVAHYDYWSDRVRRSILLDAKADLLVYGMGERPLLEIVARLAAGEPIERLRDIRGTAYRLGASETGATAGLSSSVEGATAGLPSSARMAQPPVAPSDTVVLPSYEQVAADKRAFVEMTRLLERETNPYNARRLVQAHGRETVVVNPPAWPLAQEEMDRYYGLPFTRRPHPSYGRQKIPAFEVIRNSIQIVRGCFGGCAFCSLSAHQGKIIQNRSPASVLAEIRRMSEEPDFSGVVSDLGGPTANMYGMRCGSPEMQRECRRTSCLHPSVCRHLETDHGPLVQLMREARRQPGVKQVFVASGIRMDLAVRDPAYIRQLAEHHTGGLLKVAPEHVDPQVLGMMRKPPLETFLEFEKEFRGAAAASGKELYLVPYFMAGHPGSDLPAMIRLAEFLRQTGHRPDKVQDFIPLPMDPATCMYWTETDPRTREPVYVAKGDRQRRLQRAVLQFWKPENYRLVAEALREAGRADLIGPGPKCLIPAHPPQEASKSRKPRGAKRSTGYRPHRGKK